MAVPRRGTAADVFVTDGRASGGRPREIVGHLVRDEGAGSGTAS